MALDLQGCRTLVTGGSSGIGAGLAEALAAAGAVVGICARRGERLAEVVDRCMEHSPDSRMWVVDLSDFDAVSERLRPLSPRNRGEVRRFIRQLRKEG